MKMTLRLGCSLLTVFALIGCGTLTRTEIRSPGGMKYFGWISPQGRNVSDNKNPDDIETGYLDTNVNYYYSGCDTLPTAVIKLSKDYILDDARWQPLTDRKLLLKLVKHLKTPIREDNGSNTILKLVQYIRTTIMGDSSGEFYAFTIKDHTARPIGVWYTNKYTYGIKLGQSASNKLYVYAPNIVNTNSFAQIMPEKSNDNRLLAMLTPPPGMLNQPISVACLRCHNHMPNEELGSKTPGPEYAHRGDLTETILKEQFTSSITQGSSGKVTLTENNSPAGALDTSEGIEDHYQNELPEFAADNSESGIQDSLHRSEEVSASIMPGTVDTADEAPKVGAVAAPLIEVDQYRVCESIIAAESGTPEVIHPSALISDQLLADVPQTNLPVQFGIEYKQKLPVEVLSDGSVVKGPEELRAFNAIESSADLAKDVELQHDETPRLSDLEQKDALHGNTEGFVSKAPVEVAGGLIRHRGNAKDFQRAWSKTSEKAATALKVVSRVPENSRQKRREVRGPGPREARYRQLVQKGNGASARKRGSWQSASGSRWRRHAATHSRDRFLASMRQSLRMTGSRQKTVSRVQLNGSRRYGPGRHSASDTYLVPSGQKTKPALYRYISDIDTDLHLASQRPTTVSGHE